MTRRPRNILRILKSRRMTLVAATSELVAADLQGRQDLEEAIGACVPDNWPPELYERQAMAYALEQLKDQAEQGWSFWYLVMDTESGSDKSGQLLGICGFKGRPDVAGSVEIGYSVLKQFQMQGYATEAVARLVIWAFSHQNVVRVTAETLPHLRRSIRVMEKNGFKFSGPGSEQGVVRYAVRRPDQC